MISATPKLTRKGLELSASVAAGGSLRFTKFAIGSGTLEYADDPARFTDLKENRHEFGIDKIEKNGTSVTVTGTFDSSLIVSAFRLRELGIFCEDEDGAEHLFAYGNDGDKAGQIENLSDATVEQTITLVFSFSTTANVTATLTGASAYATRADLEAHEDDDQNPHNVTKAQIGLGNVQNVAPNNMQISYAESTAENLNLISGEKISVAFGKIASALKKTLSHITDPVAHLTEEERERVIRKSNEPYIIEEIIGSADGRDKRLFAGVANVRAWSDGVLEIWGWSRMNNLVFSSAYMGGYYGKLDGEGIVRLPIWGEKYPGNYVFDGFPSVTIDLSMNDKLSSVTGVMTLPVMASVDGTKRVDSQYAPPNFIAVAPTTGTMGHPVFSFIIKGRWKA